MTIRTKLSSFGRDRQGLALLEFALALPLVLTVLLFGLELCNYGISILRVHQIAATSADNAARVRDSISEADVNEVLLGGKIVGEPMEFAGSGRIVMSDVTSNGFSDGRRGQRIVWQRCAGALNVPDSQPQYGTSGKGESDATLQAMGAPGNQIAASDNTAMVFVEVTYRYKPIVSSMLFGTPTIRSEASFPVRERTSETLNPTPGATVSVCSVFQS